jgi:diadenosine tetraphosphatase ApaH/serine/threonine PP2A family protein phosphatase
LTYAPTHDAVWCLGDVVGYGPAPNECVARVRGLNALTLCGNHDLAALGKVPLSEFREGARLALVWTQTVLTRESREWLASCVSTQTLPQYNLTLVHASPREPVWEYIETPETAVENFPFFDSSFCFFGHTHRPISYRLRVAERILRVEYLPERKPYLLQPKLLLNPGSIGQPRDGDPRAAYAIFDTDAGHLTHYRVEYDISATQRAMTEAGLPPRLVERLAHGA